MTGHLQRSKRSSEIRAYNEDDAMRDAAVESLKQHVRRQRPESTYDADLEYLDEAIFAFAQEVAQRAYLTGRFDTCKLLSTSPRFNRPQLEIIKEQAYKEQARLEELGVRFTEPIPEDYRP